MNYALIIRPLIGAAIGYVTNWIAIKMLFRPLKEYHIGKFRLPFTPGIIPKNKERIAESIGNAINENLLTEDTLRESLLSDEIKNQIKNNIKTYLEELSKSDISLKNSILNYLDESTFETSIKGIEKNVTDSIYDTVKKANLGKIVAMQIELSASEKLKSPILGLLGGNAIVSSISETAELKVNDYINTNGKELINGMVSSEINKYENKTISELTEDITSSNIDLETLTIKLYEDFILNKLSDILLIINIPKIVKDKICSMDTLELEKIILSIMKKELNALVNLGALIGFILGLLNLLF